MNIENLINENNISQKYKINNNINFTNLKDYSNLLENTIFYCSNEFDNNLLNIHKGDIFLFVDEYNKEIKIDNNRIKYIICNDNDIFEILNKNYNNVIKLQSKLTNKYKINILGKKIIFMINCSLLLKYKNRYEQLNNFLQYFNYDYILLISKKNKSGLENKILYIDLEDNYENLSKKIYQGIKYIYEKTNYNYIYKVDDDFFNFNINLNKEIYDNYYGNYIIERINRNYHKDKCESIELNNFTYDGKFYNKYAAGGYGYIISRESMYYVINNENYICNEIYEDKAIGDVLFKNNILVNTKNYADLKKRKIM